MSTVLLEISSAMQLINSIREKFNNFQELNNTFVGTPPYPMIVLDDFLPLDFAHNMANECNNIPNQYWTDFTRKGSLMHECNKLDIAPYAFEFVNHMHSALGMNWLQQVTGIKDLIPDPYLVGAGYSRTKKGHSLKVHTDFNWNDSLKLHRMLSLIVYLTPDWSEDYGGSLNFYDFNNENVVNSVATKFNRVVIWRYHKRGFHGYPNPLNCPESITRNTFRLFFYVSDAKHSTDDRPHRSLYWYDKDLGEPYDIPTHR